MHPDLSHVLHIIAPVAYSVYWLYLFARFFSKRNSVIFKHRCTHLLLVILLANALVTFFQFAVIFFHHEIPCIISMIGSYSMVSILHFPYILRGLKHAVLTSTDLRLKLKFLTKDWFLNILVAGHLAFASVYFVLFSSGLVFGTPHNPTHCGFMLSDGVYMFTTLIYYVASSFWCTLKIQNFEDNFSISAEIMNVYLIWIILAVPYLIFQIFLKNQAGASGFMIAMNILLLYVSFHLPLKGGKVELSSHPARKIIDLVQLCLRRQRKKNAQVHLCTDSEPTPSCVVQSREGRLVVAMRDKRDMGLIMQDRELKKALMAICKKSLCEENPLFLQDALEYKDLALKIMLSQEPNEEDEERLTTKFNKIYATYVSSQGHLSINVSSSIRERVDSKFFQYQSIDRRAEIFNECFCEIEKMLHENVRLLTEWDLNEDISPAT